MRGYYKSALGHRTEQMKQGVWARFCQHMLAPSTMPAATGTPFSPPVTLAFFFLSFHLTPAVASVTT